MRKLLFIFFLWWILRVPEIHPLTRRYLLALQSSNRQVLRGYQVQHPANHPLTST